jgi:hypothetical protein
MIKNTTTDVERLKLSNFVLESERITKAAKELNDKLTLQLSKNKTCKIQFDTTTGVPHMILYEPGVLGSLMTLELDEIRDVILWLKDRGIK